MKEKNKIKRKLNVKMLSKKESKKGQKIKIKMEKWKNIFFSFYLIKQKIYCVCIHENGVNIYKVPFTVYYP